MNSNPELDIARRIIENTNTHLFLTGKAGTGKTTFLKELKRTSPKRMVVTAPTGIAAINAEGMTIHSFFQLPFAPHIPDTVFNAGKHAYRYRYNMAMRNEPRYMGIGNILRTGNLLDAEFAYHTLPDVLDPFDKEAFAQSPVEFHVVCTDALTGEPVYKRLTAPVNYEFMEWVRASSSLPLVSHPVDIGGRLLLDGGISDSIPLRYFQDLGYEHNIVVLTQPKGFVKKRTRLMPLFRTLMRRYPAIIEAMNRRHLMYNSQLAYLAQEESAGRITVIAPDDVLPIGRTEQNARRMQLVYDMGRRAAAQLS